MAIDFPNSPTTGDTYTAGGRTWQWDGTVWASYGNYPDPTVLKIDTGTNRVGINNTSPTTALDVTGDLTVSGKVDAPLPVSNKTASYTLAAGDEGTRIVMNNAGATTITVDDGVFSAGDTVWIHNIGAGTTTVTAGTATVNTAGSLDVGQWEGGSLYFTSASSAIFFRGGGAVNYGTATGGTSSSITVDGDSYTLLEFTSSGTLTVTKAGIFDVIIMGGGGGGGYHDTANANRVSGGGGAGGYVTETLYLDSDHTVVIGAGGPRTLDGGGGIGSMSACGLFTAPYGGGGGTIRSPGVGFPGASGGGGYSATANGANGDGITGNNGAGGTSGSGGGGGGAGGAGQTGSTNVGGVGGVGVDVSAFRGESAGTTYYGGGGGGCGVTTGGAGGSSIGGAGSNTNSGTGGNGTANTGSGGGGAGGAGGGNGGSGIVVVRFKN